MTDMDEVNIGLPYELAMADEESRREFYASAQAMLTYIQKYRADHTALWFRFLALERERDNWKAYSADQKKKIDVLASTHVLYTWLRKKCDETSNDTVAVYMNIGHDWAKVTDLDRDLRAMIEQEEP
ncbi:hypothetical protein OO258_26330 [Pseudomonas sp. DCB_BI]|uniref:hypothetical protein n=1 Tax=Pseudomonas sp. DCB_BI TaxID=2993594 RepID=UPI00224B8130|nr:hypothetical protein [Pseudomonas sp. DCB_BI]MCX2891748.1 hypothetical protein [Pseudomonas sp. DCB_BI]